MGAVAVRSDALQSGKVLIGISGWRYAPWRKVFYPDGLPQRLELAYAARRLRTIELNGSFYSLQRPESYAAWYRETPSEFVFSVKGSRYITHMLKLSGIERALANFFASGVLELKEKLGPFLWQLPPTLAFSAERIEAFLRLLPRDTAQALALARRRDARMKGRTRLAIDRKRPLRHALEIRHQSFADPAFVALLRRYNVALVVADTAGKWPQYEDLSADFAYLRLHGDKELYASGYTNRALDRWAERIRSWSRGMQPADARLIAARSRPRLPEREIYCYFDNDVKVRAPFDAISLARKLGQELPGERDALDALGIRAAAGRRPPAATASAAARPRWPAVGRREVARG